MARALTLAGSDPTGGAGLQADLKTFHACGVEGLAVPTVLTAQDTGGVRAVIPLPAEAVAEQLAVLTEDVDFDAAKTGMLWDEDLVEVVARSLQPRSGLRLVVDPVLASGSGSPLLSEDGIGALAERLFPLAEVVTPNALEASHLTGIAVETPADAAEAARLLHERGARAVLVKGGHLRGAETVDVLLFEGAIREYSAPRIEAPRVHGTGCMLSAALAAFLAKGLALPEAVERAREVVRRGIAGARRVGAGALLLDFGEES